MDLFCRIPARGFLFLLFSTLSALAVYSQNEPPLPIPLPKTVEKAAEAAPDYSQQSFVVENRGGGGGIPGAVTVARAQPDGYTLVMSTNTTHSAVTALYKTVPYDPIKDFTPIARLGGFVTLMS